MQCPITLQTINGECVPCDGLCPKGGVNINGCIIIMIYIAECPGGTVTESDPSTRVPFINCTVVSGNLIVGIIPSSKSRIHWLLCNMFVLLQ